MNFFIIGNASSVWMKEYIKSIHIKNGHKVYLTVYERLNDEYSDEYNKMGVELVVIGKNNGKIEKIKKLVRLINFSIRHSKNERFDIIEIQSPPHNMQAYVISLCLKIMKSKVFLMFWGSDILDISKKEAYYLEKIVKQSDIINRPGVNAYSAFKTYFGNKYKKKFTPYSLRFGTLALPYIEKISREMTVKESKCYLGLDHDKISVAIGYNGKNRQQHMKVIEAIKNIDIRYKNKIQLIFHMVGNNDYGYRKSIIDNCQKYGFEFIILDGVLDFEQIAVLRNATDIFIHAQTTDGLSGTIRECLYSGVKVINPEWIPYDELKKIDIDYIEYSNFDDLNNCLIECIDDPLLIDREKNKMLIFDNYSWVSISERWLDTFNEMIN